MSWNKKIPETEIRDKVTSKTVDFAKEFGQYLAQKDYTSESLSTNQLRKFFGEVKRQQLNGYDESGFVMLKPKLAYAVSRAIKIKGKEYKIRDFYEVMSDAIDKVIKCSDKQNAFYNFITIFEAIVAYHKVAEVDNSKNNNK